MLRILVAAYLAAACFRAAPAAAPVASAPLLPPEVDLSGNWATGSEQEPVTPTITLHPGCTYNPAVWIIRQTGNVVEGWTFAESYNQGIAAIGPGPAKIAPAQGRVSGIDVIIDDGQSRYVLRYDTISRHLRGTLNGRPFWAARQTVVRTEACPGVP